MASYSEEKAAWILEAGNYVVRVGNSSRNTSVAAILHIEKEILCEQCKNLCVLDCEMKEITGNAAKEELLGDVGISKKKWKFS